MDRFAMIGWIVVMVSSWATISAAPATTSRPAASMPDNPGGDHLAVTSHTLSIDGQTINYQATAGTLTLKDDAGKPRADFFFVAYVKQPQTAPATEPWPPPVPRPITFVFNGGPGAAAVWLHLGAVGPRRVALDPQGIPGPPPHGLIENTQSWIDLTDLVLIDPVSTGYSRPAEGHKADEFYGVQPDIESIGQFIRLYLTRYERWNSPKFLAGESYGTTRAALLANHLQNQFGIDLNGIILISTVLNFQTLDGSNGNELPYALYIPTYASLALYHHKILAPDADKLLSDASDFATHEYLAALAKGGGLGGDERAQIVSRLAHFTGLPSDYIDKANLRIDPGDFRKRLLNDQRLILGRYDGRITGIDPEPANADAEYDPSLSLYLPVYAGAFNDYVRRDLNYESDLTYEVLNGRVRPWDFGRNGSGYLNVTEALRSAMAENPHLHVLVASGYDDLATPFLATNYTFDHLDLTDRLRANVTQTYYQSGHMIYQNPASLVKLKSDVAAFMARALEK